jgi:glycine/D-amino acid oxidase-like deaminating enzyme
MRPRAVVVGAGLAGVSTARALALGGGWEVVLVEQETAPARHASGRNAGMIRMNHGDPAVDALAAESVREIEQIVPIRRIGSIRVESRPGLVCAQCARHPLLRGAQIASAAYDPRDGVVDPVEVVSAWWREAVARGVQWRPGARVVGWGMAGERVEAAQMAQGEDLYADVFVIAAGAWAGLLSPTPHFRSLYRPARRHLFALSPPEGWVPDAPIVYFGEELYARPEGGGGVIASPCDVEDHPPGEPAVAADAEGRLAARAERWSPVLAALPVRRGWACLRTLTPDGRPVIGRDPEVHNVVWAAGLGGMGLTLSAAVGRLAVRAVEEGFEAAEFSPSRFAHRHFGRRP